MNILQETQKMFEKMNTTPGMSQDEIIKNIIGYSTQIDTPFGKKCVLYADHTATGRPFKMIEQMIQQKVKPMIANSHTETSQMGYFSTQLLHYAELSILKSFKVSKATHFSVPTGNGATGAFERLTKILRVGEISKMELLQKPHLDKSQNPDIPSVYISPYEHHSNILPWQDAGCNLQKIQGDKYGNMNLDNLQQKLLQNSHFKIQIVSVSATSNVTSQRTDLDKINQIIKDYKQKHLYPGHKIIFIVDAAAFCSHNRLNLSEQGLSEVDFVCISPHKHLGGSESTGVLIAKLSAYDINQPPSFPGGGTVMAVVGLQQNQTWYDKDPTAREMPGTPNAVGFYRAALTFELQDYIGLDYILEKEEQNSKYFFNRIQKINEEFKKGEQVPPRNIFIYGDTDIEIRYDVFSFNIYGPGQNTDAQGKSLFHPNYIARVLNDVFGIQVRSGCSCAGPYGVLLLGIPEKKAVEIVGELLQGYADVKPGWVRLDTFFTFEQYELDYIVEAIRLIALYGEKLSRFYELNQRTAQFSFRGQSYPVFDFSLFGLQNENIKEIPLKERHQIFSKQLELAQKLLENPDSYIKENYPYLIEQKQYSEHHSQRSSNSLQDDKSTSSDTSGKSLKTSRVISLKNENGVSQNRIKSQTRFKIQNQQSFEELLKQDNQTKNIKDIVSQEIREQLRNIFTENQNLNSISPLKSAALRQTNNQKGDVLKIIFKNYSKNQAGLEGISQMQTLQFAQDYNLLNSHELSINDIIMIFNQIVQNQKLKTNIEYLLNFQQFNSLIENIAHKLYQNDSRYITISDKIDEFYSNYLMRQDMSQKSFSLKQTQRKYQINSQETKHNIIQENFKPKQILRQNVSNMRINTEENENYFSKINKMNPQSTVSLPKTQNQKKYFFIDSMQNNNKSSQNLSRKDIMLKRAQEIQQQLNEHEKSLLTLISK